MLRGRSAEDEARVCLLGRQVLEETRVYLRLAFVDLAPQKHTGLSTQFLSEDPQFARTMTRIWWLEPTSNGTFVTVVANVVPSDVRCGSIAREGFC
jgi:hypothetical protein